MNRTFLSWSVSVLFGLAVGALAGVFVLQALGGGPTRGATETAVTRPASLRTASPAPGATGEGPQAAAPAESSPQDPIAQGRRTAIVTATEKVRGSVVTVFVTERIQRRSLSFDDLLYGPRSEEREGLGSGIVVSRDGYVVTNDHVVGNADRITVQLADGQRFEGVVVDTDPGRDLAVLKIDPPEDIRVAELGGTADIMVGEWVIALGSPFGFDLRDPQPSVSVGVVSAIGRSFVTTSGGVTRYFPSTIQTDAAINPGNSGGPLVNALGEVIGINSFILSQSGGSVGIGFAIPIEEVAKALEQIRSFGRIRRTWVGMGTDDNTWIMVRRYNVADAVGAVVTSLDEGGPAQRAGLRTGAVIISADGEPVQGQRDLEAVLVRKEIGDEVELEYLSYPDHRRRRITLLLEEDPGRSGH
jgi:serine protease Do